MKIAILTSGILPVPAVQGGAVENLTDFYLAYNEAHRLHDITVYSVWHPDVRRHHALQSTVNHYHYIQTGSLWAKVKKAFFRRRHGHGYYHYSIEYFLHEALKDICRKHYDVIVLENRPGYALKLRQVTEARLVYHLHNDILHSETQCAQQLYDAASGIVTVSDFISRRVKTINAQDTKCCTVLNGINLQAFQRKDDHTHPTNQFTLLFSGRLIPEKGVLPLLEAMRMLKGQQDIRLLILGSAALGSHTAPTPFLKQVEELANDLPNVVFTGYVDYARMSQYLQEADVAVVPSLWDEPFGLTCAEALAAGLPLIATRQGGIPEVADDSCAVMLDADEQLAAHLAAAITDLYQHPEKRQQLSTAARQRARLFDKERYAREFFEAIVAQ